MLQTIFEIFLLFCCLSPKIRWWVKKYSQYLKQWWDLYSFFVTAVCNGSRYYYSITINVPVVFMARYIMVLRVIMMLHPSKPLSTSVIKTTGTLVVLCTRVLLYSVAVCCCVLLCVRGVGRSPCRCDVWGGIQGVGGGWQASPSPSHYSVGIHGCMLMGGGGML